MRDERYLVISDTHGLKNYLDRVLEREPDIRKIIFLGDGLGDILALKARRPDYEITAVAGNCDYNNSFPVKQILEICGYRVLVCHGDGYFVKMGLLPLKKACAELGVDIAIYGHTHSRYYEYFDGLYLFNPGSVAPSANPFSCYGIMDFTGGRPLFYNREV